MPMDRSAKLRLICRTCLVFVIAFSLLQCAKTDITQDDQEQTACSVHEDCPPCYSCIIDQQICGLDSDCPSPLCESDTDCGPNYSCYISPTSSDGTGKCIPGSGDGDGNYGGCTICQMDVDCPDPVYEFCMNQCCEPRFPPCPSGSATECWPGQSCVQQLDGSWKCETAIDGDKPIDDGDEVDGDVPVTDGDEVDGDQIGDCGTATVCQRSSDCPNGQVCGNGGCCTDHCSTAGCPNGGTCNTLNGYCEWCDESCSANQCCNYHENFWYCGSCCIPPCAEGQACQGGRCVPLQCPTCGPCEICGPETGWQCDEDSSCTDGDGTERGGDSCLPANAACIEGVDVCCSGTCLMGTCL